MAGSLKHCNKIREEDVVSLCSSLSFDSPSSFSNRNILLNYATYNPEVGYNQGMSDLLASVLAIVQDEVDAFWCFVGLMEGSVFVTSPKDDVMDRQLVSSLHVYNHHCLYMYFVIYVCLQICSFKKAIPLSHTNCRSTVVLKVQWREIKFRVLSIKSRGLTNKVFSNMKTQKGFQGNNLFLKERTVAICMQCTGISHQPLIAQQELR